MTNVEPCPNCGALPCDQISTPSATSPAIPEGTSGDGVLSGRREVNTILSGMMQKLQPDCPDMVERIRVGNEACTAILALRTDATQTREAEQIGPRSRLSVIAQGGTIAKAYHPSTFSDPVDAFWHDVAALNARGGA